jgi:hypothetical protein
MPKRYGLTYKTSRTVGLRNNQIFPYVVGPSYSSKTNPYRAKFRIHKGLPGHSGKDICLGNHEDEFVAALAVELFVATYCMEYPEYLTAITPLLTSCKPCTVRELVHQYPVVATTDEINLYKY